MLTGNTGAETRVIARVDPTGALIAVRVDTGLVSAGMLLAVCEAAGVAAAGLASRASRLVALRVHTRMLIARGTGILIALREDTGILCPASWLVALCVDTGVLCPASRLEAARVASGAGVDALSSRTGVVALSPRTGITKRESRVTWAARTRVRREWQGCGHRTLCAEPYVEVELVDRLGAFGQDVVDRRITPDRDLSCLVAGKG
jgi:hypothetical protein